jgi:hypothetical protein
MIRKSIPSDVDMMGEITNDAAKAYKGIILEDRWHEPYMPKDELEHEIESGVGSRIDSNSDEGSFIVFAIGI